MRPQQLHYMQITLYFFPENERRRKHQRNVNLIQLVLLEAIQ